MRGKYETEEEYYSRQSKWHTWLAWYPVYGNGSWYFLELIERRLIVDQYSFYARHGFGDKYYDWDYRSRGTNSI